MARLILMNGQPDADAVRMLVLPTVPVSRASQLLPNETILSDLIAGRAEIRTIGDVGNDWSLILAGQAPTIYANGNPSIAQMLLYDLAIRYTCAELVPLLRQLVPTQEKSEVTDVTLNLNWDAMLTMFETKAGEDIGYLLQSVPIPLALQMAKPLPSPIDPDVPPDSSINSPDQNTLLLPEPLLITG